MPHRYRAESVGTAQILIRNSGTQYHPNSREFVQSVRPDSDRTTRNYFQPVSDQNQVVPTGSNWKDSQKSNINRSPDIRINQRH